jgi:hypothetical protein
MDTAAAEALARDRDPDRRCRAALLHAGLRSEDIPRAGRTADDHLPAYRHALVSSRRRSTDLRSINDQRQARVMLAQPTECVSATGTRCLRGQAGASNLVAFRDADDEPGRPVWALYLCERAPKPGTIPDARRRDQERVSAKLASGGADPNDSVPFGGLRR